MQVRQWQLLGALLISATAYAESTGNLVDPNAWQTQGDVNYWNNGDNPTWVYSYTQGSVSQTVDLSSYDNIDSLSYGAASWGCNNYVGGSCGSTNPAYYDQITVQLTYGSETWSQTVALDYNQGWINYDYTVTPTTQADAATLTFTSVDPGFWAGYYAAATTDAYLTVDYSTASVVTPEPIPEPLPVAADPVMTTTVLDSVITPDVTTSLPVTDTVEIPTVEMAIDVVDAVEATPTVDVAAPEPMAPAPQTDSSPADAPQDSSSPDAGSPSPSKDSPKENAGPTAVAAVMASIDVATASMESIGDVAGDPGSPVAQALAVAVMAAQGVELEDVKLEQPELPKVAPIKDNKRLQDRFWLGAIASDAKFQRYMVDAQWQRSR